MTVPRFSVVRPVILPILLALASASGCHGAKIYEVGMGGTTGTGGGGGTIGPGGGGTSASGSGSGGGGSGTGGAASSKTLVVVPGTGSSGVAYSRMTTLENGIAYAAVLDTADGPNAGSTPLVVVKAITLASGSATTLSTDTEIASLFSDDRAPVAVDGTYAYWFSRTYGETENYLHLRRAPKMGGTRDDVFAIDDAVAAAPGKPTAIATGGGYVYWASNGNGIFRCLVSPACQNGPEPVVPTTDYIVSFIVRGDWLYWASASNGKVWRHGLTAPGDVMLDGGPTLGDNHATCDIAVSADDTELWSVQCLYPYELRRVNVAAMTGTTIASAPNETSNQGSVGSLGLGTTTVYFVGSDHVFSVPRSINAATAQMLASLTTASGVLADGIIGVDDQYVYFRGSTAGVTADPHAGYVLRMAR
ncbi:MAG TPA: hypothetical protein VKQ32_13040 [Polyangia bacterium]|nr:hypothetical protein [Polyangia bacterium]